MKVTFPSLLFLTFLVLKLTDVVSWSWWWVTAPIWGVFIVALIYAIAVGVMEAMETPEQKAARRLRDMARRLSKS